MLSVSVKFTEEITKMTKAIKKDLAALPKEAHAEFVSLTPIRSGNARRRTDLVGSTIRADYPYAERLDNGWSKQAPRGMTKPFEKWFERRVKQITENK